MKQHDTSPVQAWINLNRASNSILKEIELALKNQKLPPLAWYDILLELERAPDMEITASELQEKLLLPQYALSRVLQRIEKAHFIERQTCEKDRRAQLLKITQKGIETRQNMWKIYGPAMQMAFERKFNKSELNTLAKLLQRLNS